MGIQAETLKLQFSHGYDETHVLVVIRPRPVDNFKLTPQEAETFIAALQKSIEGVRAFARERANAPKH